MRKLSKAVSDIVGIAVAEGTYAETFKRLERDGRLSAKQVNELLALILTRLENDE